MKHLKLFLTLFLAMTSVMVQAMSYPDLVKGHNRTASQPYQEFSLRLNALYGVDNYLKHHKFYFGQKSGSNILNASSFEYSNFNLRTDDNFSGSYGLDDIIFQDDHYVVVLTQITGFDDQVATVRVYKRHDPLENFAVKFTCNWRHNVGDADYEKWLEFDVTADEKKKLKEMV